MFLIQILRCIALVKCANTVLRGGGRMIVPHSSTPTLGHLPK